MIESSSILDYFQGNGIHLRYTAYRQRKLGVRHTEISEKLRTAKIINVHFTKYLRRYPYLIHVRVDSRFVLSQRETVLLCNDVSHWLGANLESTLCVIKRNLRPLERDMVPFLPQHIWLMCKRWWMVRWSIGRITRSQSKSWLIKFIEQFYFGHFWPSTLSI